MLIEVITIKVIIIIIIIISQSRVRSFQNLVGDTLLSLIHLVTCSTADVTHVLLGARVRFGWHILAGEGRAIVICEGHIVTTITIFAACKQQMDEWGVSSLISK
jgi:hypothetical protein